MATKQAKALEDLYANWSDQLKARPDTPLEGIRALFEHWGDVTAEPDAVDYALVEAGGMEAMWAIPAKYDRDRVLLCLHGGGYVLGSMHSHRKLYGHFAKAIGCRALIVNYRRAPENPHPGPVMDAVAAYEWLLQQGIEPGHIVFIGDSAGGALSIAALLEVRNRKLPYPAASVPLAPYLDTEALGASYQTNDARDRLGARAATLAFIDLFLGESGDRHDPLANPLHADLRGLPPIFIQVGEYDVLVDDSRAFYAKAKNEGVDILIEIAPEMQHVYHFLAGSAPEADEAIARIAAWVRPKLGLHDIFD